MGKRSSRNTGEEHGEKLLSEERRVTECDKSTTKEEKKISVRERELTRLPDGSYVHEIRRLGRPWGRLVMQVSPPTVAENASTAFEVIRGMVSMKMEDLCRCLMESMPMRDITGIRASEIASRTGLPSCEDNYTEAILLNAMDKMEGLVLEGLRIQMSSSRCESDFLARRSKEASSTTTTDECVVVVVLIQVRDPKEGHGGIGELMIGLIEAKILDVEGKRFSVSGVHVAGLSFTRRRIDGRDFLWSASLQSCRGTESNCCWKYVRNPDRVFAR
ncbi:hypothetical protein ACMD2_23210 [Ananas comosus]|uniref:PMI1/PMIR1-2 C-terminal domain-containing protein n=1 Tax=Ananas comosus TaxID=4615 RepID=A0A199UTV7_ANACO|nr:hypothetical protein ACMD2_23210 [Ananas comosus]